MAQLCAILGIQNWIERMRETGILTAMITVTAAEGKNSFPELLERVERGETVRILKHGRARARLVPDCDFMSGADFAKLFEGYQATALDRAAAEEIAANIAKLDAEMTDESLAH